jgi:hypothetical protein
LVPVAIPGRGKRKPDQRRKRLGVRLFHDRGAMVLDRALTDAKFPGDIFVGVPGDDQVHDFALPRCETRDALYRIFLPGVKPVPAVLSLLDQFVQPMKQGLLSGERVAKQQFHPAAVAVRDGTAPTASELGDRWQSSAVRHAIDAHVESSPVFGDPRSEPQSMSIYDGGNDVTLIQISYVRYRTLARAHRSI